MEAVKCSLHSFCVSTYALLFRRVTIKDLRMTGVGKIYFNPVVIKMLLGRIRGRLASVASQGRGGSG
jgi:hypothetical protein